MTRRNRIFTLNIFMGLALIVCKNTYNYYLNKKESIKANTFINNIIKKEEIVDSNDYLGVISIPSINLKQGFYPLNSSNNDVNKSVQLIPSDMPNVLNGTLVLASHSGNDRVSHFKNLDKLTLNDNIYIYYKDEKYTYNLIEIYEVEKTGKVNIHRDPNLTTLALITCSKNSDKQVVYLAKLTE